MYQLFTDVDDTLHPSGKNSLVDVKGYLGSKGIAGVDPNPRKNLYECVDKLHNQINAKYDLPTVVITANPFEGSRYGADKISKHLGVPIDYIPGDVGSSFISTARNLIPDFVSDEEENRQNLHYISMAKTKVSNITNYVVKQKATYGDGYRAIWIGDNGQGDLLAAKELLREDIIYASFIHTVNPGRTSGKSSSWFRGNPRKLFPFYNYGEVIEVLKTNDIFDGLTDLVECEITIDDPHRLSRANSFIRMEILDAVAVDS